MTPNQSLLFAIKRKCHLRLAWIIAAFTITKETDAQKKDLYPGKIIREPYGLFMADDEGQLVKLDADPAKPLFRKEDPVTITKDWIGSLQEDKIETSIGTLLVNLCTVYEAFGNKFPYQKDKITVRKLDNMICAKMKSNPREGQPRLDGEIYVDERLKFVAGVGYLESMAKIFTHSITEAGLRVPPGRDAFKKEVTKRYEGKLDNPVEMSNYEKELRQFDDEYLAKNDPSYGKFMAGKKTIAFRQKAFMTQGGEPDGFTGKLTVTPVIQALDEGISLEPDAFVAAANSIRFGSFSRGLETVNGGVVSKGLQRASDNWKIIKGDCGTKLGFARKYEASGVENLIGRYVIHSSGPQLVQNKEGAAVYADKEVFVRSPQYCRLLGHQTCEICAGTAISQFPNGVPIPLMEVSGGIMTDSLKLMHDLSLKTVTVDLRTAIT